METYKPSERLPELERRPNSCDLAMSARIEELRAKFPKWKIVSEPDQNCNCNNGERTTKTGLNFPCLCVCLTPFGSGDDRARFVREVGAAARRADRRRD